MRSVKHSLKSISSHNIYEVILKKGLLSSQVGAIVQKRGNLFLCGGYCRPSHHHRTSGQHHHDKKMKKRIVKRQRANLLIFLSDPSVSLSYSLTNVEERKRVKANSADEASQVEKAVKAIDDRRLVKGFKGVE